MQKTLGARTQLAGYSCYPSFFNASLDGDEVVVTVRAAEKPIDGVHVCSHPQYKGQPGRCTAGDANCNNYCNMAPENGPMADSPLPWKGAYCGETTSMRMAVAEWRKVLAELVSETA